MNTFTAAQAKEFVTDFTGLTQASIFEKLDTLGSNLDEIRNNIGGLIYAIAVLPEEEKEDALVHIIDWSTKTWGASTNIIGAFIQKYSQDTVKYVKKDKVLKRRKATKPMQFKCTALQALGFHEEMKPKAKKAIVWDGETIDKRIASLIKQATDGGADNALIVERLRATIATLDTEESAPVVRLAS